MKKFWSYCSFILLGIVLGMAFAVKFLSSEAIEINVKSIKNKYKRIQGEVSTSTNLNIEVPTEAKKQGKNQRKQRRLERKSKK